MLITCLSKRMKRRYGPTMNVCHKKKKEREKGKMMDTAQDHLGFFPGNAPQDDDSQVFLGCLLVSFYFPQRVQISDLSPILGLKPLYSLNSGVTPRSTHGACVYLSVTWNHSDLGSCTLYQLALGNTCLAPQQARAWKSLTGSKGWWQAQLGRPLVDETDLNPLQLADFSRPLCSAGGGSLASSPSIIYLFFLI